MPPPGGFFMRGVIECLSASRSPPVHIDDESDTFHVRWLNAFSAPKTFQAPMFERPIEPRAQPRNAESSKTGHTQFQFSLRTLLIVLTAFSILAAFRPSGEWWILTALTLAATTAIAHLARGNRSLGAIILLIYSVLGIVLVVLWMIGMSLLTFGPVG